MILDFHYQKKKHVLDVSYVSSTGSRQMLSFPISRFKTYREDPEGTYKNWNGKSCQLLYTDEPSNFDILNFLRELPQEQQALLEGKTNPKLYTWDIETQFDPDEFPDPSRAQFPITVISMASSNLDVVELGTQDLSEEDQEWISRQIRDYLSQSEFYRNLKLDREPRFKYLKFATEQDMIGYFLTHMVSKSPVLAGWNSDGFDCLYLQNRITAACPALSMKMGSVTGSVTPKYRQDKRGTKYQLKIPDHTLMIDMMDVVENYDMSLGAKESVSLDYIAKRCAGIGKIQYDGDLEDLRKNDYRKYVFYSCIDSLLVQLIDQHVRTMNTMYAQALYCHTRIQDVFSKIKATEALMFDYWFRHGIKVCPVDRKSRSVERGELPGAYVREPTAGKHEFVCCNDFASLYPSCIRSNNISFENYIGKLEDGDFTQEELNAYKKDPGYFVTVNNCVFKNDQIYAFPAVQGELYDNRNQAKYLVKKMDATVMSDAEHWKSHYSFPDPGRQYDKEVTARLATIGYPGITRASDLESLDISGFMEDLALEMEYLESYQMGQKLLGNSGYGASSHPAFAFFNLNVAASITSEGQALIHLMEKHIPEYFQENWASMSALREHLGVKMRKDQPSIPPSWVQPIAGDTDSLYISYQNLLDGLVNVDGSELTDPQKLDFLVKLNTGFLDQHNKEFMKEYYDSRHAIQMVHNFELETIAWKDIRLNVKKRYAQLLVWKDGKYFDFDHPKFKSKGLEVIKSSYPALARNQLQEALVQLMLSDKDGLDLTFFLNRLVQDQYKPQWMERPVEELCENKKISGYSTYILNDSDPMGVQVAPKCPYHVRALANRNWTIQVHHLHAELQYGGKMKIYPVKNRSSIKKSTTPDQYFAFAAGEYPDWAEKYWPCDRIACFRRCFLDPLNRVLESIGCQSLKPDGSVQPDLFSLL